KRARIAEACGRSRSICVIAAFVTRAPIVTRTLITHAGGWINSQPFATWATATLNDCVFQPDEELSRVQHFTWILLRDKRRILFVRENLRLTCGPNSNRLCSDCQR